MQGWCVVDWNHNRGRKSSSSPQTQTHFTSPTLPNTIFPSISASSLINRAAADPQRRLKQTSGLYFHLNSGHYNPTQSVQFKRVRVKELWTISKPRKDSLKPDRSFLQPLQKRETAYLEDNDRNKRIYLDLSLLRKNSRSEY